MNDQIEKRVLALIMTATGASLVGTCLLLKTDLSFIGAIIGMVLIFVSGTMN